MDKRKHDHLITGYPKHRARTCRGGAIVDAAELGHADAKIVSIADLEAVKDGLLDILGPRGYRVGMARLSKKPTVVSIGSTRPNAATGSEDEPDLTLKDEGTVVVFTPNTEAAKDFLHNMLQTEPWMWLGESPSIMGWHAE